MKSNSKLKSGLRFVLIYAILLISMLIIFWFFDIVLNGMFVDWFANNYTTIYSEYIPEIGQFGVVQRPNWDTLKQLLIIAGAGLILTVMLIVNLYAKYKVRKNTKKIGKALHEYILAENDSTEAFPEEYSDIAAQISDIKTRLRSHEQILKAETAQKNDLILYLAHDLKTPLASVIGYLNLLKDERDIPKDLQEKYIAVSLGKAERLEELINEFFDIARFNLTDISLQYSRINLSRLLQQLIYEFKPMLEEKGLTCRLDIADDQTLRCDADKIQRAFDNLLRNAVSYSYPNTEIDIAAYPQDNNITISFTNHGDTISSENLKRIFEQFYRLDMSRSTSSGGAGLGLAITKRIVELHRGSISATSENNLIIFSVTLPLS